MIGNQATLSDAVAYVQLGVDVALYGRPGSGRTTLLRAIADKLRANGFQTRLVAGTAGLQAIPLAGLADRFPEPTNASRVLNLASATQRMVDEGTAGKYVVLVDDAELLDDTSWGVIRAAQYRVGFPIVTGHLRTRELFQGAKNRHLARAYQLEVQSLRLAEMEALLEKRIGGRIESVTLSRIFGKSGGLPGLACGMVDIGVQEGRLAENGDEWVARQELWSPALARLVERHIAPLHREDREALETISLVGPQSLDALVELIGADSVERLEERSLLTYESTGGQTRPGVMPPLITEYYRHLMLPGRAARLSKRKSDLVGRMFDAPVDVATLSAAQPDAMFVRAVQDQVRARVDDARAEWRRAPALESAVTYLSALGDAGGDESAIDAVLRTVDTDDVSEAGIRLTVWRASWLASRGDLAGAKDLLRRAEARAVVYKSLAQAARVRLCLVYDGYTGDVRADVVEPVGMDPATQATVYGVRAAALLVQGRVAAAEEELASVDPASAGSDWVEYELLRGLIRLAKGEHSEATILGYRALERARANLSGSAIRAAAYFASLCQLLHGNYREVTTLVETAVAVGAPNANAPASLLGVLCMGSIVAGRRGNTGLAEVRLRQAEQLPIADGSLPGMTTSWPRSQLRMVEGQMAMARQELREGADRLWSRGARWNAALEHLIELELWPEPKRLEELAPRLDQVEGELVAALRAYVEGLVFSDPTRLEESAPRLVRTGRPGFAITAYERARAHFENAADTESARRVQRASERLVAQLEPGSFDALRFRSADILLTPREIQLARLAASGRSNQQIASELVLSVRTVESHIHRIMKKVSANNRRDLARFLADANVPEPE
ncbi:LuxR C-terminal-related transcriptional regulator [Microbacterium halophytorum]|uniref:LuxR C-terminal-related transcriptional regulator n=1 Tax=Microbacterium halophytorum TaxID=2067568 RepID=UPI00131A0C7F|nr:LuxR C-terminal-related transcriptional regulator [Microbacterium halophytorum]